jgi:hypothetical protein
MWSIRILVVGALCALAGALAVAFGQIGQLAPLSFSGNEAWSVGALGPGSQSEYATSAMMRNTEGIVTTSSTSGTIAWPGQAAQNSAGAQYKVLVATAACGGTATFDLPPKPFDGQVVIIANGSASAFTTGCVVATTDGSTLVPAGGALSTLAASTSAEWVYQLSNTTWYRVR